MRRLRVGASSGLSPATTRFGAGAPRGEAAVYCGQLKITYIYTYKHARTRTHTESTKSQSRLLLSPVAVFVVDSAVVVAARVNKSRNSVKNEPNQQQMHEVNTAQEYR